MVPIEDKNQNKWNRFHNKWVYSAHGKQNHYLIKNKKSAS